MQSHAFYGNARFLFPLFEEVRSLTSCCNGLGALNTYVVNIVSYWFRASVM